MGQADALLKPPPVYAGLGRDDAGRLTAFRALFRPELESEAIGEIRIALSQGQHRRGPRFIDSIERATEQSPRTSTAWASTEGRSQSRGVAGAVWAEYLSLAPFRCFSTFFFFLLHAGGELACATWLLWHWHNCTASWLC